MGARAPSLPELPGSASRRRTCAEGGTVSTMVYVCVHATRDVRASKGNCRPPGRAAKLHGCPFVFARRSSSGQQHIEACALQPPPQTALLPPPPPLHPPAPTRLCTTVPRPSCRHHYHPQATLMRWPTTRRCPMRVPLAAPRRGRPLGPWPGPPGSRPCRGTMREAGWR